MTSVWCHISDEFGYMLQKHSGTTGLKAKRIWKWVRNCYLDSPSWSLLRHWAQITSCVQASFSDKRRKWSHVVHLYICQVKMHSKQIVFFAIWTQRRLLVRMLLWVMRVSVSPVHMPEVRVAVSRVLVRRLILAMNLKSNPSTAIAHITQDIGNIAPSRLTKGEDQDI